MKRLLVVLFAFTFGFACSAGAADFGTKDEAIALVKKAISYVKEVGIDKAAPEFSDPKGKWVDRDLYLTVVDKNGIRLAHGMNAKLVGKSFAETVDVNGKAYGQEVMQGAAAKGSGLVQFTFTDPITKKQMPKESYYEKSGDLIFQVGVYKR